jgi:tetratricopeptide (TPR) repeat protein
MNPSSPNALRVQWELADKLTPQQLAKFESQLKDDPVGWFSLGFAYSKIKDISAAKRCYSRSLEISPSQSATEHLAKCYYDEGDTKRWRETLESYLAFEDLSLSHADMHAAIAEESIKQRDWQEAEQHALVAAQTYSARGLGLASRVYEGKRDWKKSEYFAAETSRSYPSYSTGTSWYFWCRRNGRGDPDAARTFAERSIEAAATDVTHESAERTFVFHLVDGKNPGEALLELRRQASICPQAEKAWEKAWRLLHTIAVSIELENEENTRTAVEELTGHAASLKAEEPGTTEALEALCKAFNESQIDGTQLASLEALGAKLSPDFGCDFWYFLGAACNLHGDEDGANKYWKKSAFGGPYYRYNATLAGFRLVKKHGPDRGGLPEEFAMQEAKFVSTSTNTNNDASARNIEDGADGAQ